jgi:hypothetical protein
MSKLDKERQDKVNTIISEIEGFMLEFPSQYETDKESMLGYFYRHCNWGDERFWQSWRTSSDGY